MKPLKYTIALALTLAIIFAIYTDNQYHSKVLLCSQEIKTLQGQIEASSLKIDNILLQREQALIELTRENENLQIENEDLKTQIREFGWLKEVKP